MDAADRLELSRAARFGRKPLVKRPSAMAIASHPLVTRVAVDVMRDGGNACDAVLAAAVAQTVVEPHMTTLTGVLSMLYFDAASGEYTYVNGSAAAPAARPDTFMPADTRTGMAIAVPGYWAGVEAALERHGSLPRSTLLAPAIELAYEGFEVSPFLYAHAFEHVTDLGKWEEGREIFLPSGRLIEPGELLVQRKLAATLERLASEGSDYFYRGEFAERLVAQATRRGGVLTMDDLDSYEARWMEPARSTYREFDVVGAPPPDQGGTHVIELLNLVELLDFDALGHPTESPEALVEMIRMHNAVYEDGANQGDPRSYPVPLETIVSKEYARIRRDLIQMAIPSTPEPVVPGSNQVTVVDPAGNTATVLHSLMGIPWMHGFVDGVAVAAAGSHYLRRMPAPGDRISSIACPHMVVKDGVPFLAAGSPSQTLIAASVQNIVNVVDFGMDVEQSTHMPRFGGPGPLTADTWNQGVAGTMIEADISLEVREAVAARGVNLATVNPWCWNCGSWEAILRDPDSGELMACGDPRRNADADGF